MTGPDSMKEDPNVQDPTTAPFDDDEEPALLGAAAPLTVDRKPRRQRHGRGKRHTAGTTTLTPVEAVDDLPENFSGIEYVYAPDVSSTPPLGDYLRNLWDRRRFISEMASAEVRGTRTSTALGSIWGVLDPLFQAIIYFFLFAVLRGENGRPIEFLHVLVGGMFLFQLATSALNDGGGSVRNAKNLMLNSTFPRASLPLTTIYKSLVKFLPTVFVYLAFHFALQAPIHLGLLLLPVLFVIQLFMMVGIALLASTLVVYFTDAKNFLGYVTRVLFFSTPVIFPLQMLMQEEAIYNILKWQPLFGLFASYQMVFDGGVPELGMVLRALGWAAFFFVVGAWAFLRNERNFTLRL